MKKILILWLLFCFSCATSPKKNQPPKWINRVPDSDYYYESVGIAVRKNESVLQALMKIAGDIEAQYKSELKEFIEEEGLTGDTETQFSRSSKIITDKVIGKIELKGLTKHSQEETGSANSKESFDSFEHTGKLTFSSGNKKLIYSNYYKETGSGVDSSLEHHFEIVEQNCTLKDLMDELNSLGCNIEFYYDNESYYTLISCNKKRLLENIK